MEKTKKFPKTTVLLSFLGAIACFIFLMMSSGIWSYILAIGTLVLFTFTFIKIFSHAEVHPFPYGATPVVILRDYSSLPSIDIDDIEAEDRRKLEQKLKQPEEERNKRQS
jgi:hypothetical protein